MLFSNGAIAGSAPVPDEAAARGWPTSPGRCSQAPGALEADGRGRAGRRGRRGRAAAAEGWPDDVAVLVAHRRETALEPLQLDLLAVPAALPGVRRRLGAWLDRAGHGGAGPGRRHGRGRRGLRQRRRARLPGSRARARCRSTPHVDVDGVLTVAVRDEGTWRPPDRDPGDRGRGLLIMRQLVDTVVLEEEDRGTTVTLSLRLRRTPDVDPEQPVGAGGRGGGTSTATARGRSCGSAGAVDEVSAEQLRIRLLEASHGGTGAGGARPRRRSTLFSSAAVRVVLAIARIAPRRGLAAGGARARGRGDPAHPGDQRPGRPGRPALTPAGRRRPGVAVWGTRSGAHPPGVRLRRSDVNGPGYRRRRAGRGFAYYDDRRRADQGRPARPHPRRWPSRRPGRTSGSAPGPTATSRPPASTPRAAPVPLPRPVAGPAGRGEARAGAGDRPPAARRPGRGRGRRCAPAG